MRNVRLAVLLSLPETMVLELLAGSVGLRAGQRGDEGEGEDDDLSNGFHGLFFTIELKLFFAILTFPTDYLLLDPCNVIAEDIPRLHS